MTAYRSECDPHEIGKRIKLLRDLFNLSQGTLGKIADCGTTNVSNWETGRNKPTIQQALNITDYLGVTLDYIYAGRVNAVQHELALRLKGVKE